MSEPEKCQYCEKIAAITGEVAGRKVSLCLGHADELRKIVDEIKRGNESEYHG